MRRALIPLLFLVAGCTRTGGNAPVRVGSKAFTESVILGELVTFLAQDAGGRAEHRRQLGGTQVLWNALLAGEIDVYPDYTGTIAREILGGAGSDEESLRVALAKRGVVISRPLGFSNTYAVGMKEEAAARLGIRTLSDLARHPELRFGFSSEFMDRSDGWPSLQARYHLPQQEARGLDHDLAYRGLESGTLDATDLYSTDAEIRYYHLRVLVDDLHHFPDYHAVLLARADLATRAGRAHASIRRLEGSIDEAAMIALNARAKLDRLPESVVAADFLAERLGVHADARRESFLRPLLRHTGQHLALVAVSLGAAILFAIPLGILASRRPRLGRLILAGTGIVQTIPSLALLVFMIPLLGIGAPPAIVALFLYSLLPIVRNTCTGLTDIAPSMRESAEALGLPPLARLWRVELPLASRAIVAGVKTSAVINVGTATLGALVGAGGYGQPILTGIRLDDVGLILQGAVPAAVLALAVELLFDRLERLVVPRGLRLPVSA
ncbi:MAG: ABC transporter permease subunit [Myxococcales bacterium]|nr:ABC transporter permease subunit [Myxococcales bacterium]